MIILLDVDGPLAQFHSAYLDAVFKITDRRHTEDDLTVWDIGEALKLTDGELKLVNETLHAPGFAARLSLVEGCKEGVEELQRIGDVYFCTALMGRSPTWAFDRINWIERHFGINYERIVFATAKQLVHGDMLVDDKLDNIHNWQLTNPEGTACLWDAAHNRPPLPISSGVRRVHSWSEIVALARRIKSGRWAVDSR
jgi:5'(3')-deoxyribonucleotidase